MKKLLKKIALISVILAIVNILISIPTLKRLGSGMNCFKKGRKAEKSQKKKLDKNTDGNEKCTALATLTETIKEKKNDADKKAAKKAPEDNKTPTRLDDSVYVRLEAPLIVNVLFVPSMFNGVNWQKNPNIAPKPMPEPISLKGDMASKLIELCTNAVAKAVKAKLSK